MILRSNTPVCLISLIKIGIRNHVGKYFCTFSVLALKWGNVWDSTSRGPWLMLWGHELTTRLHTIKEMISFIRLLWRNSESKVCLTYGTWWRWYWYKWRRYWWRRFDWWHIVNRLLVKLIYQHVVVQHFLLHLNLKHVIQSSWIRVDQIRHYHRWWNLIILKTANQYVSWVTEFKT